MSFLLTCLQEVRMNKLAEGVEASVTCMVPYMEPNAEFEITMYEMQHFGNMDSYLAEFREKLYLKIIELLASSRGKVFHTPYNGDIVQFRSGDYLQPAVLPVIGLPVQVHYYKEVRPYKGSSIGREYADVFTFKYAIADNKATTP